MRLRKGRCRTSDFMDSNKQLLDWARQHKAHIELRNKVILAIAMIAWTIGIAGYLNYLMLLQVSAAIPQFFAELGLLIPIIFINTKIIIKVGGDNLDAAIFAVVAALALAVAVALALAAVVAALAAVALAFAVVVAALAAVAVADKD